MNGGRDTTSGKSKKDGNHFIELPPKLKLYCLSLRVGLKIFRLCLGFALV
jgi:hypothetical protein